MGTATLDIDLDAIVANWAALDAMTGCRTAAVVKADAYGLGAAPVAARLARAGARQFFVASAEEGAGLREVLGHGPEIFVFSGHMIGDAPLIRDARLLPMLNSPEQLARHREALGDAPYGVQLDTGMNRLGMEPEDWAACRAGAEAGALVLVISHLACADDPGHAQNEHQLEQFRAMTDGLAVARSLSATGGILLGPAYHFDMCRPGIGLYGGAPFANARPVIRLSLPVIQAREVAADETVGYSATWTARSPSRIATLSSGYADGLIRAMGGRAVVHAGQTPCPVVGRVSMDLLTVDISHLETIPDVLQILGPHQGIDDLAAAAGTIGYEILTSLGHRYARHYAGAEA